MDFIDILMDCQHINKHNFPCLRSPSSEFFCTEQGLEAWFFVRGLVRGWVGG